MEKTELMTSRLDKVKQFQEDLKGLKEEADAYYQKFLDAKQEYHIKEREFYQEIYSQWLEDMKSPLAESLQES